MKTLIVGLLFIALLFSSCPETFYEIAIKNQTNHKIGHYFAQPGMTHVYPDTLIDPTPIARPVHPNSSASGGGVPLGT